MLARGILFLLLAGTPVFALASSGTIDSTNKYAWGNVAGYINFAPNNSTVTITDSAITGYAWSQNDGWINFQPAHGGVTNDGNGTLSGWAWDESQGWVSFSGVSINSSGKFTGQATGSNGYTITFDCTTYCNVQTTWRPTAASSNGDNGPVVGSYGTANSATPAPQTPPNSTLEPSGPPSASGGAAGAALLGASRISYDIPASSAPISASTASSTHRVIPAITASKTSSSTLFVIAGLMLLALLLVGAWRFLL